MRHRYQKSKKDTQTKDSKVRNEQRPRFFADILRKKCVRLCEDSGNKEEKRHMKTVNNPIYQRGRINYMAKYYQNNTYSFGNINMI